MSSSANAAHTVATYFVCCGAKPVTGLKPSDTCSRTRPVSSACVAAVYLLPSNLWLPGMASQHWLSADAFSRLSAGHSRAQHAKLLRATAAPSERARVATRLSWLTF